MIEQILKDLGFSEKEIRVYLTVLQHGKTTPATVGRLTGINRSTVYALSKDLIEKGVILEDIGSSKSFLIAQPPEDLMNLAKKEERELKNKKVLIDQAIIELQKLNKSTKYSIPKITFIYEEDIENFLHKQSPEWSKSILEHDAVWWGFQDTGFVKQYQKWIDWYWRECAPKNLVLKLLTNESKVEEEMAERKYDKRIVKFWDKGEDFTATTWINGDYLVMIMTEKKPRYLVQIYDATLAHNMREMFKGIWPAN